jgi:tmRNA-binding protein
MLASRVEASIMAPKIAYTRPSHPSALLAKKKIRTLRIKVDIGGMTIYLLDLFARKIEVKNKIPASSKMRKIKKTCSIKSSFLILV